MSVVVHDSTDQTFIYYWLLLVLQQSGGKNDRVCEQPFFFKRSLVHPGLQLTGHHWYINWKQVEACSLWRDWDCDDNPFPRKAAAQNSFTSWCHLHIITLSPGLDSMFWYGSSMYTTVFIYTAVQIKIRHAFVCTTFCPWSWVLSRFAVDLKSVVSC